MHPIIFDPPPLHLFGLTIDLPPIYSFGLMMAIAFMVAATLTGRELDRKGFNGEAASSLVVWAAVGGIGGARLWNILEDWHKFLDHPVAAVFTGSGFTWYGGLLGGLVAVSIGMRRNHLPWGPTADAAAPGVVLAHAIGRIGCQLAGDGDWGRETHLPWGMAYPKAIVGWPYPEGVVVHPTPVYEMIAYTAIFAFLWSIRKNRYPESAIFWLYIVLASPARLLVEFVRVNPAVLAGLSTAQWVSIGLAAIALWRLWSLGMLTSGRTAVAVKSPAR